LRDDFLDQIIGCVYAIHPSSSITNIVKRARVSGIEVMTKLKSRIRLICLEDIVDQTFDLIQQNNVLELLPGMPFLHNFRNIVRTSLVHIAREDVVLHRDLLDEVFKKLLAFRTHIVYGVN
jgi:hypothetical protein